MFRPLDGRDKVPAYRHVCLALAFGARLGAVIAARSLAFSRDRLDLRAGKIDLTGICIIDGFRVDA